MSEMKYCFGVDLGGTTVKMGFFQADGEVLDKWEIETRTENQGENILPDIAAAIHAKLAERGVCREDVVGIGMGIPAPVNKEGVVNGSANIGWGYKEVKCELEELTGITSVIGNDANVAALGEMWKGGGQGYKNLVVVTLGTGVGGGVIVDGEILVGTNGAAGEIGHICVDYNETDKCGCGKTGCLEQYASATGVVRLAKRRLEGNTDETVLNMDSISAKDVFDAVKAGDKVAIEIAEEFGRYLGYGLATVSAVVDPDIFVIGGGVSRAGKILFGFVEGPYLERAFFAQKEVKFALAELGNDAGIYGAAKLALS